MRIVNELATWRRAILQAVPGETGCHLRNWFYGYTAGKGVRVLSGVTIYAPEYLTLGDNVGISTGTQIHAGAGVRIGNDTLIGPMCAIWSVNHRYRGPDLIRKQGYDKRPVHIGANCWIAAQVTIVPGVEIGEGCAVWAGSVVTKSCPPGMVLAGSPARVLGPRERLAEVVQHPAHHVMTREDWGGVYADVEATTHQSGPDTPR